MADPAKELIRLAMEKFGNLLPGEAKMLRAAAEGTVADVADQEGDEKLKRESAWGCWETWGEHRKIRAELLRWVLVDEEAKRLVAPSGVSLRNALVLERLDLCDAEAASSVILMKCAIPAGLLANGSEIRGTFSLAGSFVGPLEFDGILIQRGLFLRFGFSSRGTIRLLNAKVDGDLDLRGARLDGDDGVALVGDGASIDGSVYLSEGFSAVGSVRLVGASVGGIVVCTKCEIQTRADGISLACNRIRINGSILIHVARFLGTVSLSGARIACAFDAAEFRVSSPTGLALFLDGAQIDGDLRIWDAAITGQVLMSGMECKGNLVLRNVRIERPLDLALVADGARVRGSVAMNDRFTSLGDVRFVHAEVGGSFECDGAVLASPNRVALDLGGASIGQSVLLRNGCTVSGETRLLRTRIAGDLSLIGGRFDSASGFAINAERLELAGAVYCGPRGSRPAAAIAGGASFAGARIARSFMMRGLRVEGDLLLNGSSIGEAICVDPSSHITGVADLTLCRAETMSDCKGAWDGIHTLKTYGLSYGDLPAGDVSIEDRVEWIERGTTNAEGTAVYSPQAYKQLASAYARMGRSDDYVKVKQAQFRARYAYEKPVGLTKWSDLEGWGSWLLRWTIDKLLGCGYDQMRPARWMFVLWLLGFGVFLVASNVDLIAPASDQVLTSEGYLHYRDTPPDYQPFNPLLYSADAMLPIIDLHQERFWLPGAERICYLGGLRVGWAGALVRVYLWFHIAAGWILSTLFVVGLSGIVKNEDGKSQEE